LYVQSNPGEFRNKKQKRGFLRYHCVADSGETPVLEKAKLTELLEAREEGINILSINFDLTTKTEPGESENVFRQGAVVSSCSDSVDKLTFDEIQEKL